MTELLIVSLSTAFIITAVEELLFNMGKWRGLLALFVSIIGSYLTLRHNWGFIVFTSFGASFAGMTCAMLVGTLIEAREPRVVSGLPRRVPPI